MDVVLILLGLICILIGLIGCFVPALPGPPFSFLGLLLLHWTSYIQYSNTTLWVLGIATLVITILDFVLPVWITNRAGGSKYATRGATLGLIAGMFILPPVGIIFGPFLGAFIGEMIVSNNENKAFKSAFGAFIGFLLGTGLKLIISAVIAFYFFKSLILAIF